MTEQERIEMIREAQDFAEVALEMVRTAIAGTRLQEPAEAQGHCGLDQAVGNMGVFSDSLIRLIEEVAKGV